MAALIQFVDSISPTPTVRLDVNDGVSWFCQSFKAPPPRLRRSVSQNAMRDGQYVSASSYEARTVTLELTLVEEVSEEFAAQSMQALWRELDRPENWLLYHPDGLDEPVFFRLSRSDVSDLEELWTTPIAREITVELPAEPFALGLMETLGPFTVSNDPAAESNAMGFDIPAASCKGDLPAPIVLGTVTSSRGFWLASGERFVWQAEGTSLFTDTANPGGGPDAAMSGTTVNNYVSTSFATSAAMVARIALPSVQGTFRLAAIVRRSDATSAISVQAVSAGIAGPGVATPLTTSRQFVDLGLVNVGIPPATLNHSLHVSGGFGTIFIHAARTSGAGSLQWDAFVLVPASAQMLAAQFMTPSRATVDSTTEVVVASGASDPIVGGEIKGHAAVAGAFPLLAPGVINRMALISKTAPGENHSKSDSHSVVIQYHPRYLYVRPSAS